MMCCPACTTTMDTVREGRLRSWRCGGCGGRAAVLSVLRKAGANPQLLNGLWQASARDETPGVACPSCRRPARRVTPLGTLEIDVCRSCTLLYFDPGELDVLVAPPDSAPAPPSPQDASATQARPSPTRGPPPTAPQAADAAAARQAFARMRVQSELSEQANVDAHAGWRTLFGGLGVETGLDARRTRPLVCLALALILIGVLLGLGDAGAERAVALLGFDVGAPLRSGGLPILLHPLLQEDGLELLLTLFVLFIAGDDVEHCLGAVGTVAFVLAIAVGSAVGGLVTGGAEGWVYGSAGLATGMVTFYTARFPWRGIGLSFLGRVHWLPHVPLVVVYLLAIPIILRIRLEVWAGITGDPFDGLLTGHWVAHLVGIIVGLGAYSLRRR